MYLSVEISKKRKVWINVKKGVLLYKSTSLISLTNLMQIKTDRSILRTKATKLDDAGHFKGDGELRMGPHQT